MCDEIIKQVADEIIKWVADDLIKYSLDDLIRSFGFFLNLLFSYGLIFMSYQQFGIAVDMFSKYFIVAKVPL